MKLTQSSPPDILPDKTASSAVSLPTEPFLYQADIPDPAPVPVPSSVLPAVQQQVPLQLSLDNPSGSPLTLPEEAKQTPASPKVNLALATARESEIQLQQALASLEAKLSAAEEEKVRIKSDLEELMEKHSMLEKDFLKEKDEAESYRDRYTQLQHRIQVELLQPAALQFSDRNVSAEALWLTSDEISPTDIFPGAFLVQNEVIDGCQVQ
ncbi:UNVERIFIED_CONTAM: hypothetical protein FKN15_026300 [Acipenser sinensis]